jgi:hypothetical protein
MTDIQLLCVTELLSQFGDQVVKTERAETDFLIRLTGDRWIEISAIGNKFWFLNGQRHRTDGPTAEYASGDKFWYLNGKLHRTDGPAFELTTGYQEWWLHGVKQTSSV